MWEDVSVSEKKGTEGRIYKVAKQIGEVSAYLDVDVLRNIMQQHH